MRTVLVALMLAAGCVDSGQAAHRYTCDARRNCAGDETWRRGMSYETDAATPSLAEVEIVDECEAVSCGGALACTAICEAGD
jgi:hypothetical protein